MAKPIETLKQHVLCVILFAFFLLVTIITFWLGGKGNEMASHISFASAAISIVLGIVVIFYMFHQNRDFQQNISEMKNLISEVPHAMKEAVGTITKQAGVITDTAETMEQRALEMTKLLESPTPTPTPTPELEGETFTLNLSAFPYPGLLILYYTARVQERDGEVDLQTVAKCLFVGEDIKWEKVDFKHMRFYTMGLLHCLSCFLKPGSIDASASSIEVSELPTGLKDSVLEAINERLESKEGEIRQLLEAKLKAIDAEFEAAK